MLNVTVIKAKDILKHGLKLGIIIMSLFFFQKILSSNFKIEKLGFISDDTLVAFLKINLPIINQINSNDENLEERLEEINPLRFTILNQLNVAKYIKPKEYIENEEINQIDKEATTEDKHIIIKASDIEQAKIGLSTEVMPSNVPNKYTNSYHGVQVKNETDYQLTEEMLAPDIIVNNKNILIFHTHTCESYTPSENFNYQQTSTYRTTDLNYNVARVGTELTNQLNSYGYNTFHNTTYHDYPAYNGSYGKSLITVENLLKENPDTDVVIDIHRDAIGDYSYAPTVKIGDEEVAQIMFVIGTDGGGLEHPNWNQNLKFAVKIQEKANELYPGLFKPIILRNSRYNQHLAKGACIIEVGATGNRIEQCLNSMKYFAKVISEVMK